MLITEKSQLNQLTKLLDNTNQIAIDTEFYWTRTYYPELCIVQIATDKEIFLIDTLKDLDFSPLKSVFENKNIQKIMHSATNDIPIIKRFFNCEINNIFDTQLAATFLGFQTQMSLKTLLKETLNIEMEKDSQFSDWRKRPLSRSQINYAIKDVEYLITLKEYLDKKLEQKNLKKIFEEELLEIATIKFNTIASIHNKTGNIKKYDEDIQRNIILIAQWREKLAQDKNIPVRFIFNNKTLCTIAHIKPTHIRSFEDHSELRKLKLWIKKGILNSLKLDKNIQHLLGEKKLVNRPDPETIEKVINFFNSLTKTINFDNTLIASKKDIRSLIYNLSTNDQQINNKLLKGWRYELVGKELKEYILNHIK